MGMSLDHYIYCAFHVLCLICYMIVCCVLCCVNNMHGKMYMEKEEQQG